MSWKFIMWAVGDRHYPIIFPEELVHSEVAQRIHPLFVQMAKSMPSDTIRTPVSAGFIDGLVCTSANRESETMSMGSRPQDTGIINRHPYDKGMETAMSTMIELTLLQGTIEGLMARMKELMGDGHADNTAEPGTEQRVPQFADDSCSQPNTKLIGMEVICLNEQGNKIHKGIVEELNPPFQGKIDGVWWETGDAADWYIENGKLFLFAAWKSEEKA